LQFVVPFRNKKFGFERPAQIDHNKNYYNKLRRHPGFLFKARVTRQSAIGSQTHQFDFEVILFNDLANISPLSVYIL